ncbi:PREDICTED: uncharacterized protein LOC105151830 [Acromyrmex echinatior]|uniref:uncharacterized protein LOC105151830 n=1 Tax=Acromyrmex echinatior TaxID=103372 RepID=UPI000580EEA5|nr:PREDICTED: uncharacterized protein LOC105151830 [Acromyrmex echinatior]
MYHSSRICGTLRVVLFRESGDKERRQNGEATTKIRGKLARVWYDPLAQFAQAVMPISSPRKAALRGELRYANSRLSAQKRNPRGAALTIVHNTRRVRFKRDYVTFARK